MNPNIPVNDIMMIKSKEELEAVLLFMCWNIENKIGNKKKQIKYCANDFKNDSKLLSYRDMKNPEKKRSIEILYALRVRLLLNNSCK